MKRVQSLHHYPLKAMLVALAAITGVSTGVASAAPYNPPQRMDNVSYMVQTKVRKTETLNDKIFDPNATSSLRKEYENQVAADEARDNAGLSWYFEAKSRYEHMRNRARSVANQIYRYKMTTETAHLRHTAEGIDAIREPVAAAVLATALYTGHSMRFRLPGGTPVTSTVALKDKSGAFSMPLFGSGLSSTVAYNQEDKMNAELAQRLAPNVSAVVGSSKRGSAQIVYSVSF